MKQSDSVSLVMKRIVLGRQLAILPVSSFKVLHKVKKRKKKSSDWWRIITYLIFNPSASRTVKKIN